MEAEKKTDKYPEIKEKLKVLIERFKAGSPTDSTTYWISLKPFVIAKLFEEEEHIRTMCLIHYARYSGHATHRPSFP